MKAAVKYQIRFAVKPGVQFDLASIISRYFQGASVSPNIGLYDGREKDSYLIDIIGTPDDLQSIIYLAGDIKVNAEQEAVLLTQAPGQQMLLCSVGNGGNDDR